LSNADIPSVGGYEVILDWPKESTVLLGQETYSFDVIFGQHPANVVDGWSYKEQ